MRGSPFEILQRRRALMNRLRVGRGNAGKGCDRGQVTTQLEVPILREPLTFDAARQADKPEGGDREHPRIHHGDLLSCPFAPLGRAQSFTSQIRRFDPRHEALLTP